MDKVFFTNITRTCIKPNDDLYELLKVDPAKPVPINPVQNTTCDFLPTNGKQYVSTKKSKLKVKTVRDIRNLFEKDIMSELPSELEKQQNLLLRKIKGGTSGDEKTKSLAKNMLISNKPLTKSSWQMLMNINPEGHTNSMQYVLWNGKPIRINGSKGGKNKFICNYDVGKKRQPFKTIAAAKKKFCKKGLLQNSLSVNFKPGPLTRKMYLDKSYQKYHVGSIDIVNLPKPGLEIQPLYGSALDPTICNFVNSLREENGTITEKWAEFAVSVVGSLHGSNIRQINEDNSVTFDLNYKHDQTRLLMRQDGENKNEFRSLNGGTDLVYKHDHDFDIIPEVRVIMNKIIETVEISLVQDDLFMEDNEIRDDIQNDSMHHNNKDKLKRKYGELDRLAVTVIRLSDDTPTDVEEKCQNSFCALGCVCSSLKSTVNLKGHCGRLDCMFKCRCDFSKHKWIEGLDNDCPDLLPGLLNLNNKINCNLSKEEQKFHQTVILTGDKSIVLKSKKRNTKSSKKYAEFYSSLSLKPEPKAKHAVLAIIEPRLNCDNIEPLCMVHNLYKCFCKGRFTECLIPREKEVLPNVTGVKEKEVITSTSDITNSDSCVISDDQENTQDSISSYPFKTRTRRETFKKAGETIVTIELDDEDDSCSRVKPYEGRKFSNGYYQNANSKILDMEINDTKLRKRLAHLAGITLKDTTKSNVNSDSQTIAYSENEVSRGNNYNLRRSKSQPKPNAIVEETVSKGTLSKETTSKVVIPMEMTPKQVASEVTIPIEMTSKQAPKEMTSQETAASSLKMIVDPLTKKRLLNQPKVVKWLESSYKQFKRRLELGPFKATLEPPKKGKVSLYPWEFILSRYSERKNLFLVTNKVPYRIFMAVNANNPFFENCINIDDIRFADLYKYPTSVKNLLTNARDLKENFCILFGLSHCWEFVGSVTKLSSPKENNCEDEEEMEMSSAQDTDEIPNYDSDSYSESVTLEDIDRFSLASEVRSKTTELKFSEESPEQNKSQSSKWFIMTIENDFTEIQFYNRGFFVKYASIIQAIHVARTSGKTVRLSSQKVAYTNGPQFGIYAVPSTSSYYVFVGPYELDEPLGIETLKPSLIRKAPRTRGVWITTSKVDNIKVIDNPLSFLPAKTDMVPIEEDLKNNETPEINETVNQLDTITRRNSQDVAANSKAKDTIKIVKPIKIRKTNGFYHLTQQSILKPLNLLQANQHASEPNTPTTIIMTQPNPNEIAGALCDMPVIIAGCETLNTDANTTFIPISRVANIQVLKQPRPVAEVAPQIKIAAVYSEAKTPEKQVEMKKREGGMFILKPEEINQRIEKKLNSAAESLEPILIGDDENTMDVEYFLDNADVCPAPSNLGNINSQTDAVFIECKNVELGAICGYLDRNNRVSFQFPLLKPSEFYEPEVAFTKINQIISRKVYIPPFFTLEWHIVDSFTKLKVPKVLTEKDFRNVSMISERGFEKIPDEAAPKYSNIKTYSKKDRSTQGLQETEAIGEQNNEILQECQTVEDGSQELLDETAVTNDAELPIVGTTDNDAETELILP
ncbi:uncharacterized protein LOC135073223 [Ostrinia nubilalis]|uniref:uncharacterized protein LOC135073223 n=1 Tax=Ostrinia nubilalis TaxID=29057 RepID=UPI0030823E81